MKITNADNFWLEKLWGDLLGHVVWRFPANGLPSGWWQVGFSNSQLAMQRVSPLRISLGILNVMGHLHIGVKPPGYHFTSMDCRVYVQAFLPVPKDSRWLTVTVTWNTYKAGYVKPFPLCPSSLQPNCHRFLRVHPLPLLTHAGSGLSTRWCEWLLFLSMVALAVVAAGVCSIAVSQRKGCALDTLWQQHGPSHGTSCNV